jgi:hypothetical protein
VARLYGCAFCFLSVLALSAPRYSIALLLYSFEYQPTSVGYCVRREAPHAASNPREGDSAASCVFTTLSNVDPALSPSHLYPSIRCVRRSTRRLSAADSRHRFPEFTMGDAAFSTLPTAVELPPPLPSHLPPVSGSPVPGCNPILARNSTINQLQSFKIGRR